VDQRRRRYPPLARELLEKRGTLRSLAATEEDSVYRLYYDFEQPLSRLQGHQILAINRGEKEKMLSATVLLDRVCCCRCCAARW